MMFDTGAEDVFARRFLSPADPETVNKNIFPAAMNMYVRLPHHAAMLVKERNKNSTRKLSRESKINIT